MKNSLLYATTLLIFIGSFQFLLAQGVTLSNPSSCNLAINITDNNCPDGQVFYSPDQYNINVSNAFGTRLGTDVYLKEVRLLIRHEWAGDLDISLISPSGKTVKLSFDNGGGNDDYGDPNAPNCGLPMIFSMAACQSIKDGIAPFLDGTYQPEESFFLFNDGTTNPNGVWKLQICDDAADDIGTLEFLQLVFESITCLPITNVNVLGVDTTTVRLDWAPDDCTPVIIEYGPPGFTPGTNNQAGQGTLAFANACSPYNLQGLQPFTEYEIYIRRSCNFGSNFSDNSCPIRVTTGCLPPPATVVERFDGYENCSGTCGAVCDFPGIWRNGDGDDFDWIVFQDATPTVSTGPDGDVNGGISKYVYLEASGAACTNGKQTHLISNCIRINKQGADTCHLSFNYHMFGTNMGTLRLQYSTDGGASWLTMWEKAGNQGNIWHKVYLSLNQFTDGSILRFRFVGIGGSGPRGDMALDNIVFFGSEDLGAPDTPYYVDADGDGYGNPNQFILSCLEEIPNGYTLTGGDCNDNNSAINPGASEIPCNSIDNNCSGNADENILPTPSVTNDTICSGEAASIFATPLSGKPIFWYGSLDGDDVLNTGSGYFPNLPENNSPVPVIYRFYAEESDFVCRSGTRAEAIIVVNPRPNLSHTAVPSICPSDSFDLASVTIEDANFTGATITFHSGTPATMLNQLFSTIVSSSITSTYYYLAANPAGCTDENSIVVSVKPAPSLSFVPAKTFGLCLQDDGIVSVSATGGAGGYSYLWNTGDTDNDILVQADTIVGKVDKYALTVTDAAGCSIIDTVTVTTTKSIDSVRVVTTPVTSCGGNDGSFTINPLGGRAPFSYRWSSSNGIRDSLFNISTSVQIHNLLQGAYSITISDSSPQSCEIVLRQVIINGPSAVVNKTQINDVTCAGASNGNIILNVIGGSPIYQWSNGATTSSIQNIPGGAYAVTITDGLCQTVLSDLIVKEPEPLKTVQTLLSPSCAESTNGTIDLSVFGGTKNYSFLWNSGSRREDLNNIAAGNYQVTITDAKGCELVESIQLDAPSILTVQVDSIKNSTCKDANNGYLKVQSGGGTMPYHYEWNTGSIAPVLTNLSPGNYAVTVTDFKGCQRILSIPITQPDSLQIDLVSQTNPRCIGENNGALNVQALGGTAPFTFTWNTGATGNSLTNLGVGTYILTLTDVNGCSGGIDTFNLTATSPIALNVNISEPECLGRQDGVINIQPIGSTPFTYKWSRGDVSQNLVNVSAGTYSVTVEDAQGCLFDTTVTVEAPQAFDLNFGITQPSCHQSSDGIVRVNFFSAGTPPVQYNWSNGSTSKDLMNLTQGDYVLSLMDSRGCKFTSDTIAIQNPAPLQLTTETLGQIACKDDSTGFIEVAVRGGTQPYRYDWVSLNIEEEDVFNLPAGEYRLVVRDTNDCPIDTTFRLNAPEELLVDVEVRISGECETQYSNELRAQVSGGRAPYRYLWSNGSTDAILTNVPAGDYELTVQDANNCTKQLSSIKVRGAGTALAIDTFFVNNISCFGANDGKMTVRIAGGSPPFLFHFNNGMILDTNAREITVENLPLNNNYNVTVTDISSTCTVVSSRLSVTQPLPLSFIFDNLNEPNCFGGADGAIFASTYGGKSPYTYRWINGNNVQIGTTEDLSNVPNGTYTGIAIDANGCRDTINQPVVVQNNRALMQMTHVTTDVKCKGDRTGAIDINITGGKAPYTYRWSNNRTTEDISGLAANAYIVTVTDADTCRTIFTAIPVEEPDSAITINGKVNDVRCYGETTGSIEVLIQGGTPPFELIWEYEGDIFVENTTILTKLKAGTYFLSVRDANQCIKNASFEVKQPDPLIVSILRSTNGNIATAEARGGTPEYTYLWNTGATTPSIEFPQNGDYAVTVTDSQGCDTTAISTLVDIKERVNFVTSARLYPNPTSGDLMIECTLYKNLNVKLEIWNTMGQQVENQSLGNIQILNLPLNLNAHPAGLYQVTLLAEGKRVSLGNIILIRN